MSNNDLSDVTFMIPVKIDSEDRITNLNIITMYLREHFNTKIIIAEQDKEGQIPKILGKTLYDAYILYKTDGFFFHKTRLINVMAKQAKTPIIAMYDSDILFAERQYISAANSLRSGKVDFIYPFSGKLINITKNYIPQVLDTLSFYFVKQKIAPSSSLALGGCVMYNREMFIRGGMMNENFISYGPEDSEQDLRFKKLGYRTDRINEPLYHLDHIRTKNSQENHAYSKQNWNEMNKIKKMSATDIRNYVSAWPWLK